MKHRRKILLGLSLIICFDPNIIDLFTQKAVFWGFSFIYLTTERQVGLSSEGFIMQ